MAFIPAKESRSEYPWVSYPAATGTYVAGQIVQLKSGVLTALTAALTTTPQFINKSEVVIASPPTDLNGGKLLAMPYETDPDEEYYVPISAAVSSGDILAGTLGSVSSDGLKFVTGTAGKVLLLSKIPDGSPIGFIARVKFVQ
ncbi:MAG: hypothetical protein LBK23_11760 [Oscillospiraceae bacterium]|jgi:hypothetical protein|nr:hypothetical protein [Oscillospiraceae bacterium]